MPFDPATAQPLGGTFDPSTAKFDPGSARPEELPDTGFYEAAKSGLSGMAHKLGQTAQAVGGQKLDETPAPKSAAEEPMEWGDIKRPKILLEKATKGLFESAPVLAGGVAGGLAGTSMGGPWGGVAGGALGAGAMSAATALGPFYAEALKATPDDPEGAFDRSLKKAGIEGAIGGVMWEAFKFAPFERAAKGLLYKAFGVADEAGLTAANAAAKAAGSTTGAAIKDPAALAESVRLSQTAGAKDLATQALGVQPGLAVAGHAAQNIYDDKPAQEGVLGDIPGAVFGTALPMIGHAAVTRGAAAMRGRPGEAKPATEGTTQPANPDDLTARALAAQKEESRDDPLAAMKNANDEERAAQTKPPDQKQAMIDEANRKRQEATGQSQPEKPPEAPPEGAGAQVEPPPSPPPPPAEAALQRPPEPPQWDERSGPNPTVAPEVPSATATPPPATPRGAVPQEDVAAAPAQLASRPISTSEAVTSTGRVVPVEYALVEAGDLRTSHTDAMRENPDYPQGIQPRDRTRAASELQLQSMLSPEKFRPELLGPSPDAANGAPIVGADGVVESGNMRSMALRRAYDQNLPVAETYRQYLAGQGFPVEGMKAPVLVRINRGGMSMPEREAFAREANKPAQLAMSSTERAVSDAAALPNHIFDLARADDLLSAANRPFAMAVLRHIASPQELGTLVDANGALSQDGIRRIQGAILAKAYGDPAIIATLIESTDGNYKAIGTALLEAAPDWAKMRAAAGQNQIPPALDITPRLVEAVKIIARARQDGRNVVEFVKQTDMLAKDGVSPEAEELLKWMLGGKDFTKRIGKDKIADAARFYAQEALKVNPGPALFGEAVRAPELIEAARERAQGRPQEAGPDLIRPAVGEPGGAAALREGAGENRGEAQGHQPDTSGMGQPEGVSQAGVGRLADESPDAYWDRLQREAGERDARADAIAKEEGPVVLVNKDRPNQGALIHPSADEPGHWQYTFFDENGFSGHTTRDTKAEALRLAMQEGYRDTNRNLLRQYAPTDAFRQGNERADQIQRENQQRFEAAEKARAARPTVDQTSEGAQPVIPGAERLTPEEMARRKAVEDKLRAEIAMKGKQRSGKSQRDVDETPLFGGKGKQGTLFDGKGRVKAGVRQNMLQDFVQFVRDNLFNRGTDPLALNHQAADYVMKRGQESGYEVAVIYDRETNRIIEAGSNGNPRKVDVYFSPLSGPGTSVVHHNHPSGRGLSDADVALLAHPMMHAVIAHGHDGQMAAATLTPAGKNLLKGLGYDSAYKLLFHLHNVATTAAHARIKRAIEGREIPLEVANHLHADIVARALDAAGVIDYIGTRDLSKIPDIHYALAVRAAARDVAESIAKIYGRANVPKEKSDALALRPAGIVRPNRAEGLARILGGADARAEPARNDAQGANRPGPGADQDARKPEPYRKPRQLTLLEDEDRYRAPAPPFFSALTKSVDDLKLSKAHPSQWLGTLKGLPGVKEEELAWSGVREWLADQKGLVTKEQVLDHLRSNEVQIQDITHGTPRDEVRPDEQAGREHGPEWDRLVAEIQDVRGKYERAYRSGNSEEYANLQKQDRDLQARQDALHARMIDETMKRQGLSGKPAKFSNPNYQTPGGENYREMLLTMPTRELTNGALAKEMFGKEWNDLSSAQTNAVIDEMRRRGEAPNQQKNFTAGHFDEPNVLAHVRMNDRTGPNGEKILHVEEIQSDWHQKGRKEGYAAPPEELAAANRRLGETRRDAREALARNDQLGFDTLDEAMRAVRQHPDWADRWDVDPADRPAITAYYDAYQAASKATAASRIPNAPLKTTWHEMALKRVLRHAAENGYDKVTWTPGDVQNERYDLSKHVKEIEWEKREDGTYAIGAVRADDPNQLAMQEDSVPADKLADYVGKEIAQKIIDGVGHDYRRSQDFAGGRPTGVISGLDLKIGGSGMKGFYDKMLPAAANKIGKPFGAKVGETEIAKRVAHGYEGPEPETNEDFQRIAESLSRDPDLFRQFDDVWHDVAVSGATFKEAMEAKGNPDLAKAIGGKLTEQTSGDKVHSMDITPAMREHAVEKGFPLFEDKDLYTLADLAAGGSGKPPEGGKPPEPPEPPPKETPTPKIDERAINIVKGSTLGMLARRLISPGSFDAAAKAAAAVIRKTLGQAYVHTLQVAHAMREVREKVGNASPEMKEAFARAADGDAESLAKLPADMQALAKTFKEVTQEATGRLQRLGQRIGQPILADAMENYLGRYWKPKGAKAGTLDAQQKVLAALSVKNPLTGPKSFLKSRHYDTWAEARAAGMEPIFDNPVDAHLAKLAEMDRFWAGTVIAQAAKRGGFARFSSRHNAPEGWEKLEGPEFVRPPMNMKDAEGNVTHVPEGAWYAPEGYARVMNNFQSKGLEATVFRDANKAMRKLGNAMNMLQLGFSAFHPVFTTIDAQVSRVGMAIDSAMRGQFGKAAVQLVEGATPINWFTNMRDGNKLLNAILAGKDAPPEMQKLVEAFGTAGGRVWGDQLHRATDEGAIKFWKSGAIGNAMRTATLKYPDSRMRQAFNIAARAIETTAAPTFDYLVPRQKLGVFSRMAADWIERNPAHSEADYTRAMQDIWESVDNRLGMMVYDNLFWNKTLKDIAFLTTRSVGWNLGSLREVGGGLAEAGKAAGNVLRGRPSDAEWTRRMSYLIALPVMTGLYGAMYQYLSTGQGPEELKDYMYPKTGMTLTKNGQPERVAIPSYTKDAYSYWHDPAQTLANKAHPLISLFSQAAHNKDFYGHIIRNYDDPVVKQVQDVMLWAAKSFMPFSVQSTAKQFQEHPAPQAAMGMLGFTAAPGYITNPEGEEKWQEREHKKAVKAKEKYERQQDQPSVRP